MTVSQQLQQELSHCALSFSSLDNKNIINTNPCKQEGRSIKERRNYGKRLTKNDFVTLFPHLRDQSFPRENHASEPNLDVPELAKGLEYMFACNAHSTQPVQNGSRRKIFVRKPRCGIMEKKKIAMAQNSIPPYLLIKTSYGCELGQNLGKKKVSRLTNNIITAWLKP
jgi:hypothetical protein